MAGQMNPEYSVRRMTVPERMLYIVGLMQTVMDDHPKALAQVRSAIHHWELAIEAEGTTEKEVHHD
jgi:hypothetical protein